MRVGLRCCAAQIKAARQHCPTNAATDRPKNRACNESESGKQAIMITKVSMRTAAGWHAAWSGSRGRRSKCDQARQSADTLAKTLSSQQEATVQLRSKSVKVGQTSWRKLGCEPNVGIPFRHNMLCISSESTVKPGQTKVANLSPYPQSTLERYEISNFKSAMPPVPGSAPITDY